MEDPLLHIYSQSFEHGEAWVLGSKEGLIALRDALNTAITAEFTSVDVRTADGESYNLLIVKTSLEDLDNKEIALPYSRTSCSQGKHPIVLIGPAKYRELMAPKSE